MEKLRDTLQDVIETAHIGLAELDAAYCFVSMNRPYREMLGLHDGELIGQHWSVTVHPDDHGRAQDAYRLALGGGQGYVEIRGLRRDSKIVYQSLAVTRLTNEAGELRGYQCLRQNISRYKRDQAVLQVAIESAPNGVLMLDSNGLILSANAAVGELFEYSKTELIGRPIEALIPPQYRERHGQRTAVSHEDEVRLRPARDQLALRKGGTEIPVQVHLNPIATETENLTLCTVIDIAERVRYEEQLELAKQAAEAANRAKSDFLARMSHEIRTPMNLIMGMNNLLLESPLNGDQQRAVDISHRNVQRLLHLINGILDLSKVEAGKLTLVEASFDLHDLVQECSATLAPAMKQKELAFETRIDESVARCWLGDGARVQQVLLNLLGNALKFTEKGSVEIWVWPEPGKLGKRGLRFEVIDTGCGIPVGMAETIFEPFQQAEGSMTRKYEGTGLGLAIARTLVEMMGGTIRAEPGQACGSKFVFTIYLQPVGEEDVFRESLLKIAEHVNAVEAGTKILIAEDNPENVYLLRSYLKDLPLELDYANDGAEAVNKRRRVSYDVILMDVQMPVMDGYTATSEIRAWEKVVGTERVPIVAVAAHALTGAAGESMQAGCDGHVTKPIDRTELLAAIARYAKRPQPPRAPIPASIRARIPAYLANRTKDLEMMRAASADGDFATVQRIGHDCKGTGAGYGFPEIGRLGAALEAAARASDCKQIANLLRPFEAAVSGPAQG